MFFTLKVQPGLIIDLKKAVSGERALSLSLFSLESDLSQQKALTFSVCQTEYTSSQEHHVLSAIVMCLTEI